MLPLYKEVDLCYAVDLFRCLRLSYEYFLLIYGLYFSLFIVFDRLVLEVNSLGLLMYFAELLLIMVDELSILARSAFEAPP
jgi:hypothetical protein